MLKTFKKLFDILPHSDRWKFAVLFILLMIGTGFEIAGIGMIPVFISAVSNPDMILNHEWLGPIATYVGIETGRDLLIYGGVSLVAIFFIKGCYLIWLNYVKARFTYNRFKLISSRLFENYLSAPYTFHLERNTAELIRNVTSESKLISHNVLNPLIGILMEGITVLGIFCFLLFVEPWITVFTFILVGGGGGLFLKSIRERLNKYGSSAGKERSRMIQGVEEGLGGFKDVIVMNRQKLFIDRFKEYVLNLTSAQIFKKIISSSIKPTIEFLSVLGLVLIAFFMIWQGRSMGTIIPMLGLFGAATVRLMPSVQKIVSNITQLRFYIHALKPVHRDMKDLKEFYEDVKSNSRNKEKLPFEHSIEIKNVWFQYPNSDEYVLKNVNLAIGKETAIGFVGPSGAGKSTIVDVILGLLEPKKGQVMVDGKNISEEKRAWQNNVGYIPQFIYLTDDTIRNNIAFGIPEEMISVDKIQDAVEAAQLEELIDDLPQGLDTKVGEDGVQLSGGQRQRIGIARALYDNPDVLIMDEGTSSLDNKTEKQVISAIEALKGERTIIMIAHRLTTVKNCDQLFMMKKGEIVNRGNYKKLLDKSKEFQKMSLAE